jgi:hypothetical protein
MSKKVLSLLLSVLMVASLCCVSLLSASADSLMSVSKDTTAVHVGDTVTFTVNLKYGDNAKQDYVAAIDASILYDEEVLKVAKKSSGREDVSYGILPSPTVNYDLAGEVKFNAANGSAGIYDYDEETDVVTSYQDGHVLVKAKFEVIKDAEVATLKLDVRELFNMEKVNLTADALTAEVSVDCKHTSDTDTATDSEKDTDTVVDTDTVADEATDKDTATDTEKAPVQTGDTTATVAILLVLVAAAVVAVIARKRLA